MFRIRLISIHGLRKKLSLSKEIVMNTDLPVLPILNYILNAKGIASLKLFSEFSLPLITIRAFFYPFIGYYVDHKIDISKWSGKKMFLLTIAAIAGMSVSALLTWLQGTQMGEFTENYLDTFTYLVSIWIFLLVKWSCTRKTKMSEKTTNVLSCLGNLTFGIFLLDMFLKYLLYNKFEATLQPHMPVILV